MMIIDEKYHFDASMKYFQESGLNARMSLRRHA